MIARKSTIINTQGQSHTKPNNPPSPEIRSPGGPTLFTPFFQSESACPCDGGCPRCVPVQAKLKIGQPNDKYEQEADRVADQVMRMPEPDMSNVKGEMLNVKSNTNLQKQPENSCPECEKDDEIIQTKHTNDRITPLIQRDVTEEEEDIPEEEVPEDAAEVGYSLQAKMKKTTELQRQEMTPEKEEDEEDKPLLFKRNNRTTPRINTALESRVRSLKHGGQPLTESAKNYFQPRFGADFNQVRIHTGSPAARISGDLNARAFTFGKNIVFNTGEYSEHLSSGRKLIAHELTHILQNTTGIHLGRGRKSRKIKKSIKTLRDLLFMDTPTLAIFPETKKILRLIRRYSGHIKNKAEFAKGIQKSLDRDSRWYGMGLLYFGPERRWPIPRKFRSIKKAPKTRMEFFNLLKQLKPKQWTKRLRAFIFKVFQNDEDQKVARGFGISVKQGLALQAIWMFREYRSQKDRDADQAKILKRQICEFIRKHHKILKGDTEVRKTLKQYLVRDDLWYTTALLEYGPETEWPFPDRHKPPNEVPNTITKFLKMIQGFQKGEFTKKLTKFASKVFPKKHFYLFRYIKAYPKKGLENWIVTHVKLTSMNIKNKKTLCHYLREFHQMIRYPNEIDIHIRALLKKDDRWYTLGLLKYGPEKDWPVPAKYKPGHIPNSKDGFFELLRVIYREKKKPAEKQVPDLGIFINYVFEQGDKKYAVNLFKYGIETEWPKDKVQELAGDVSVQPEIPKTATGYKTFEGKEFISGITYNDVIQGAIADCFLMAALAAIAKVNATILDKMVEINLKNGVYTVYFYNTETGNIRHTEYLLPGFPVRGGSRIYGHAKEKTELWVSIVEKAYAAWQARKGGYKRFTKGGSPYDAFRKLLGKAEYKLIGKADFIKEVIVDSKKSYILNPAKPIKEIKKTAEQVKNEVITALNEKRPVAAGTYKPPWKTDEWKKVKSEEKAKISKAWKEELGDTYSNNKILPWHTYAILGINGSDIQLYNPHGDELKLALNIFIELFPTLSIGAKLSKP